MSSAFFGLDIALRALRASQQAIEVTSHNVANANTPGYSRQSVTLQPTPPYTLAMLNRPTSAGQMGTGVMVADVIRSRSSFLDYQIRKETATLGRWEAVYDTLDRIQVIFNEPSNNGINQALNKFWQAWQSVANNPEDRAIRAALVEQASALTTAISRNADQLAAIEADVRSQVQLNVSDINGIADQIARLNLQIATSEADGNNANDLRDQRDLLLDRLSHIVGISTTELATGEVGVFIGGRPLVDRTTVTRLVLSEGASGNLEPHWEDGQTAEIGAGQLKGLILLQNEIVPSYRQQLDEFALRIRDAINSIHARGYGLDGSTGLAFFTGDDARSLAVSEAIQADPAKVASAVVAGKPGDGTIALAIAQLQHVRTSLAPSSDIRPGLTLTPATGVTVLGLDVSKAAASRTLTFSSGGPGQLTLSDGVTSQTLAVADMTGAGTQVLDFSTFGVVLTLGPGGTANDTADNIIAGLTGTVRTRSDLSSINQDYETYIANLGIDARSAETMAKNQDALVNHLERQRDSISGVSLDDETVNLVRFQHAYQAAARVITAMDEMLDRLINGTGIVGR